MTAWIDSKSGALLKLNPKCFGIDIMAKRYFSHSELKGLNNKVKPSGTMGNHYLEVCDLQDGSILVEGFNPPSLSKEDRKKLEKYQLYLDLINSGGDWVGEIPTNPVKPLEPVSKVILRPEWTLGYNCGEVWAIQPTHLIKDPIRRALREEGFPKSALVWVDDLYPYVSEDSVNSASCVIDRSYKIYNRASMEKSWRIDTFFFKKGTPKDLVVKAINGAKSSNGYCIHDIFGYLPQREIQLPEWVLNNPFYVSHEDQYNGTILVLYHTGSVHMYFSKSGEYEFSEGRFYSNLQFTPNQRWEGRGYSGGHVSVGSNVDNNESEKKVASLIERGLKGRDITTMGNCSGYYPAVEWEE